MNKRQVFIILTYLFGVFMGALDQGITAPALTTIIRDFDIDPRWGVWTITIYVLVYAASMPMMGKLADRYGRKRMFMVGIAIFALGSLASGLAQNIWQLLAARCVQALGGGGIAPIATAEIGLAVPREKRGMALGFFGMTHGLASIVAPLVGGLMVAHATWHWIFFVNIPISLVVLLMASRLEDRVVSDRKPLDVLGTVTVTLFILSLMYVLTNLEPGRVIESLSLNRVWSPLVLALALILPIIFIEKKASDPVINIRYFTNRQLFLIFILSALTGMVMMSILFVPAFAEALLGFPAGKAGYMMAPLAVASVIAAPLGGMLLDRLGGKKTILVGFSFSGVGALVLSCWLGGMFPFMLGLIILGFGIGLVVGTPISYLILAEVAEEETSSAIAVMTVIRSMGTTLGPTIMAGFITQAVAGKALEVPPVAGFQNIYLMVVLISVTGLALAGALRANHSSSLAHKKVEQTG